MCVICVFANAAGSSEEGEVSNSDHTAPQPLPKPAVEPSAANSGARPSSVIDQASPVLGDADPDTKLAKEVKAEGDNFGL